MDNPQDAYNRTFVELLGEAASHDIHSDEALASFKALEAFSKVQVPLDEQPEPQPTTRWGKAKVAIAQALDNETTRTLIKAGGAFAGVALVAHHTVDKERILERQALAQANQRIS